MNCPKCKDQSLSKRGYDSPANCRSCGGMWLDYETLPDFMESMKTSFGEQADTALNDEKTGMCPAGHGIMIRAKVDVDEPFYLEKCGDCGGIWFDNGEWQRVINHNLTENINELWCKCWQRQQRKEKDRKSYLEANRKLLGDALFDELMKLAEALRDHPDKGRAIALLEQEILR